MPLPTQYMKLLYNDLTTKERDIIKRLKGHLYVDDGGDGNDIVISFGDFSKYMNFAEYGQKRAVAFMKKYNKTTPLSISKTELSTYLAQEKGNDWEKQRDAFNNAWNTVDYYKNDVQTPRPGARTHGSDNALNFGELTDFFHMFKYLKSTMK